MGRRLHDVGGHHGGEYPGHDQRGKHRKHCRPSELLEEFADHTAHKRGGQEHCNQCKGGGNHRQANFVSSLHGSLHGGLAHTQMAFNIFDFHNGVVDQNTHYQRERQQRHHIAGKAHVVHADKRRNNRQRQRYRRHKRGAPVAQEEPHHDNRQHRTLDQHGHGGIKLLLHRSYKVKGLGEFQIGVFGFQLSQGQLHCGADFHFAGTFAARNLKTHDRLAIEQGKTALLGNRIFNRRHLIQTHALAVAQCKLQVCQFVYGGHRGQGAHGLLGATQIRAAAGTFSLYLLELA